MTSSALNYFKTTIREKTVYTLPEVGDRVKLNQNENPYDLPDDLKRAITEQLRQIAWNRYPRLGSPGLRERLGRWLNLSSNQLMVGNGSNEILLATMASVLEPGRRMITIEPTFSLYRHYGQIYGSEVIPCRLRSDFAFPVEEIITEVERENTALTVLCSPNNPTGSRCPEPDLRRILDAAAGLVLVDEAYLNFCDQDFSTLLPEYDNLILTRTFSKALAFATGRFGYGIASPEIVEQLYKVLPPYNLNGLTERAAEMLMDHSDDLQPVIARIIAARDRFISRMGELSGITVYPSESNFFLFRPDIRSDRVYQALMERGFLVRDVSHYPGLDNFLRINTGSPMENNRFIETLKEILQELS